MGGGLKEPFYISVWQADADQAMLDHMSTGMEIDYATRLVNDEADYKKKNKNDFARISSAATGGRGYNSGSSEGGPSAQSYNKSTGEPLSWKINGINITGFYGNVGKVDDDGQFLPKVTKEWFTKNPHKKCPQKFKDTVKAITGSSRWKKQQKKRERKIAAAAAARDGGDDAELCSSSPN